METEQLLWATTIGLAILFIICITIGLTTEKDTMTLYVNHNHPNATLELTTQLIQHGVNNQQFAQELAQWIIQHRVYTWKGLNIVHYG